MNQIFLSWPMLLELAKNCTNQSSQDLPKTYCLTGVAWTGWKRTGSSITWSMLTPQILWQMSQHLD